MPPKESQTARGLGRKGSRASMACLNCRQRKIKCDIQHKATGVRCTQCQDFQVPCAIEPSGDRRKSRVGNTSEHLSALHGRMKALEDMLLKERAHNDHFAETQQRGDQPEPQDVHTSPKPHATNTAAPVASHPQNDAALSMDAAETMVDLHQQDTIVVSMPDTQLHASHSPNFSKHAEKPQDIFGMRPYSAGNPTTTRVQLSPLNNNSQMETLSTGMHLDNRHQHTTDGSVAHDLNQRVNESGIFEAIVPPLTEMPEAEECSFYGPTSQPYLQSVHEESPLSASDDLETDLSLDMNSIQVRRLLFQNYWDIHSLAAKVVVDKRRFLSDQAIGKRSQYYSTFLEHALLACATRTSTSSAIRELGEQYLERAKSEMLQELEHPNLASMQGFLLLSDFEATRGRDRLGWTYCGIACRSLFDLGLHENSSNPSKGRRYGSVDASSRHQVFLTSFVYDQLWSLYLGRPSSISLEYLQAARRAIKDLPVPEELDAWVSLCVQIAKVTTVLNSSTWTDAKVHDRQLAELAAELDVCFENLPSRLRYEEGSAVDLDASAYGLNIQLYGIRIVFHRLWTRLRHDRRNDLEGTETQNPEDEPSRQWSQTKSTGIIYHSAIRVAKLIRTYKRIYGVEKIITIMLDNMYVAATALISHTLSQTNIPTNGITSDKDIQWLRSLSETLEEVQKYYPITTVMISTLFCLVEGTALSGIFRARRGSVTSKSSPSTMMPPLFEGGWGSRDAFSHDFAFDMGSVMDPPFALGDDRYFQNPTLPCLPGAYDFAR